MPTVPADRRSRNGRTPRGLNPIERFMAMVKVDPETRCWVWTGGIVKGTGYAQFQVARRRHNAHRWAYETFVGPVPEGLVLDHLCRVRHCVNPWHLEPVTCLENVRRGVGHGRETHCPHGHAYDEANTYRHRGRRHCKACRKAAKARFSRAA